MLNLILALILFPFSLYATQETELIPTSYFPASVWYNAKGEFCVIFGTNLIVIDKWHYAVIEDDDINY